jgi:DNA-binding NarL/FixJ family response regulator
MDTVSKTANPNSRGGRHFYGARTRVDRSVAGTKIREILQQQGNSAAHPVRGAQAAKAGPIPEKQQFPPPVTGPCRVLVADDHPLVREGVVALINRQPDMQVVAEASNGREAVAKFLEFRPDITLLDLRMPLLDGAGAVAAICANTPDAQTVILTTYRGEEDIYRALRAGARGYLLKDSPAEELVACIRAVSDGKTWVPPAVGAKLAKRVAFRELTPREMETLEVAAAGKSNKEIGVALNISEATVKVHMTHIMDKLKVTGRTEALNVAVRRGLIYMDTTTAA